VINQADLENCSKTSGKYVVKMPGRITNSPEGKGIGVTNDKTIIGGGASGEFSGGGFRITNRKKSLSVIRGLASFLDT
jgi:pectate lyase